MSQFDDLNEALAALKTEMKTATTATEAISRLGKAADAMGRRATAVEARLKICEDLISALDQSIAGVNQSVGKLGDRTTQQWETAVTKVLGGIGAEYVDAVASEVGGVSLKFKDSIEALRREFSQREQFLTLQAKAMEERFKTSEDRLATLDKSVSDTRQTVVMLDGKIARQWKESMTTIMDEMGREYVDTVACQVKEAGEDFSKCVSALRAEWTQRESALRRTRKWIRVLVFILALLVLAIAGIIAFGVAGS